MKGKRGCRFGCFHVEMILGKEDRPKVLCRKGWPRVAKAGFSRLQYETVPEGHFGHKTTPGADRGF